MYSLGIILFTITTLTKHYLPAPVDSDHTKYCRFCQKRVPINSKHCSHCNMCRTDFDHHCLYVNNCVTISNYYQFYFGLLFFITGIIINITQTSIIIDDYRRGNREIYLTRLSEHLHKKVTHGTAIALFVIHFICNFGFMVPITALVAFHVFFQAKGITTYDYLMKNINPSKQTLQSFCCSGSTSVRVAHS